MKFLFLAFLLLLNLNFSFAEEEISDYERGLRDGMQRVGLGTSPKKDPDEILSEANRKKHSYQAILAYGPDYNEVTTQIGFYKFLNSDQLIGLKMGYAENEISKSRDGSQLNISAEFKQFLGNSFYFATSFIYLKQDYFQHDYYVEQDNSFYRGFGAGLRIGNQWSWEHFTIGCDWIGIGTKFIHLEKDGDDVHNSFATLLNTYIGYSF